MGKVKRFFSLILRMRLGADRGSRVIWPKVLCEKYSTLQPFSKPTSNLEQYGTCKYSSRKTYIYDRD